jgi:hypothetical protein
MPYGFNRFLNLIWRSDILNSQGGFLPAKNQSIPRKKINRYPAPEEHNVIRFPERPFKILAHAGKCNVQNGSETNSHALAFRDLATNHYVPCSLSKNARG